MSERDAVDIEARAIGAMTNTQAALTNAELRELMKLLRKERERIESWKREEVLRDEREAGKDAEIAALKNVNDQLARQAKVEGDEVVSLRAKVENLVEAGDALGYGDGTPEQFAAWTAAKEGT